MSTLQAVELGVLGPLQVRQDGAPIVIPGAKPRAILTMLGLHSGSVVSAETLIELLWGDDPPRTANKALQTHISSLRHTLGDGFVLTEGTGWTLAESEVDASRYKLATKMGRDAAAAGNTTQAVARFEEALALWRGIPELPDGRRGTSEKTRWIEGNAALVEDRADALLATGRAAEIVGELEAAVADAPLRERRWGQLMLALYRAGRQGEALGAYQRARALLAEELGVDPGPDLRRLEAAIVGQDTALEIPAAQDLPSVTRTVTFLLTDIEGSTAAWEADAGAMAVALARHDELVEQVVTSRGGRLIKTRGEGDATFSVFERASAAAAAAIELQDAIFHEPWGLQDPMRIRVALHTGEVELRDGDYFGRAVNRAARLRSLAIGGQILCSGAIAELVVDSLPDDVVLADLGMRQLRNLARPEHVFELRLETAADERQAQTSDAPLERPDLPAVLTGPGPFVGRGRELEGLVSAWQTALAGGMHAVLIAGEPGVGKTRLAGEWSQQAYQLEAIVLYGRCDEDLGAPYQPFAEALRSLVPCLGTSRLRAMRGVEALLTLVPGLTEVLPDLAAPTRADPETERYALFDAVVALLGLASASAPVILILDDLHWAAKPTLLLLRHLLRFGEQARVQIVGTYRSTDLDRSHPLAAMLADLHRDGTANRIQLSGLDEDDVTAYVAEAGYDDEELARALASVTGGNPFFLIEALRHVDESGGRWDPSTLPQGVREAVSRRLSRLPAETNKALATAAVVGSRFAVELVERVVEDDLVDAFDEACKAGIVIEEPGGRYRFNHAIVRQSLLAELPSVRRMRLHQRIATTLENEPGADDELLAELAHHYFECAWAGNAAKAVEYCRRAADQAMARLAYEGAADLYDRALHALEELDDELPDRNDQAAELLIVRCEALLAAGDVASAAGAVSQLQAATVDSARRAAWATSFDGQLSMLIHPERLDEVETALGAAAQKLAELGDAAGEAKAHTVRAACLARLGRIGDGEIALDDALTAARRARDHRRVNAVLAGAPLAALWGPNPVPRAGGRCLDVVRLLRITTDSPAVEATSTRCQAVLEAFRGRAAAARRMIDSARRTVTELGLRHALLEVEQFAGIVELIVDEPAAAEPHLRKAYNGFRRMGLDADTAETAALLGRACLALDREAEADELCAESERLAGHALKASIAWRTLRARLLSRGNDHDEARRVAEAAVRLAERTDALVDHGDACLTLATVLGAAGDLAGVRAAAERAVGLYEEKGAAVLAEKARRIFGGHGQPAAPPAPEAPAVELDNACVRAGERVAAAIDHQAWDEFERLFAPGVFVESRRKIVGFAQIDLRSGEWPHVQRRVLETGAFRLNHVVFIAVRGERLALARMATGTADVRPGAPYDEFLLLYGIDEDGRIALEISFDIEDIDAAIAELDAAHARFDERHPPARRLENAASQVSERYRAHFAARDWDALAEVLADDICVDDRRRVVNAGIKHGRDAEIANLRAAADVGITYFTSVVIAARGERLILARVLAGEGGGSGEFRNEVLGVIEINSDNQHSAIVLFELDDFDDAIAELDARYIAGEAAAHAHVWSVLAGAYAALNRHEFPATKPDWVNIDHRGETAFGAADLKAYLRAGLEPDQDTNVYIEAVHRLTDLGAVFTYAAHETSHEGFDAEWRGATLMTVDGEMVSRSEVFDEADLHTALERFDQRSRPARRLENAASQATERYSAHFAARDWDELGKVLADDISVDDRRRVVNAGIQHGRDSEIANLRATTAAGIAYFTSVVIAARGQRLILARVSGGEGGAGEFLNEVLGVIEINSDNQIAAIVVFDFDDFDAAIAELDARYLAGEAAAYAHTWSVIVGGHAMVNRRELPPTTPDCVSIDHRRGTSFAPGDMTAYFRAGFDLDQNIRTYVEVVHRLSDLGAVCTHAGHGISHEGFDAEWRGVDLATVEGDMVNRCEVFDEEDLDAAIAKFDQLSRPAPRLENAASQVAKRFSTNFAARDWTAITATLANDISTDDRRRVVGAGLRAGRDAVIAELSAVTEIGVESATSDPIATRGENLVLNRAGTWGHDRRPEAFLTEMLSIVEINAEERMVALVSFDVDDFEAAIAELDARYLAGEAAAYSQTWSLYACAYAAFNRHELPPTTPDCVNVDHRGVTAFAPGDLTPYSRVTWDVVPDIKIYAEAVHRLSNLGAVVTHKMRGTSKEGFEAEWREISLGTVEGGQFNRSELFDEADLDAALARFEELHPPTPRLGNSATHVFERLYSYIAAGDWPAVAQITAENVSVDDRRRVVNAGILHGRDANIKDAQASVDVGFAMTTEGVLATRGERLGLLRVRVSGYDPEAIQNDALNIVEIDSDERIVGDVVFDLDDVDAAFAELDARYIAGEAAPYRDAWSVIVAGYAALNRYEVPPSTPDYVNIDHRLRATFEAADLGENLRAAWDLTPELKGYIEVVHRLSGLGTVVTHAAHGTTEDGLNAEWRGIHFLTLEGDMVNRCEMFDEADLDDALAKFEELSRPAARLVNRASRTVELFLTHFAVRDWDAMAELLADDVSADDRRSVVNAGIQRGRDAEMANWHATSDVWSTNVTSTVVATRGERLALIRFAFTSQDQSKAFDTAAHAVIEIDDGNRVAAVVVFDLEVIDAAFAELDARYLAGEAAAHAHTWSVVTGTFASVSRNELPAHTPDCMTIDHRRVTAFAPGELNAYIRAGWELDQTIRTYVEVVHRLSDLGAVCTFAAHGVSHEGFDAEWRGISLSTVDGDMVNRSELFDEADLDAALARFEQLSIPALRLKNSVAERLSARIAARDWDALAQDFAADYCLDDRRRVVNAGVMHGRDAAVEATRVAADLGLLTNTTSTIIASRGERLTLERLHASGPDPESIQNDALNIVEIDADERIAAVVMFDLDDFDAAFEELEARYLAGEAADHADTWSVVAQAYAALNRRALPATTPDWTSIDHRRFGTVEANALKPNIRAWWDITAEARIDIEAVHRLTNLGAVVTHIHHATWQEGAEIESREIVILTIEGDKLSRCEIFDEARLDTALARFEEMQPQAPRLENAAGRIVERYQACFLAHDWAAMGELLAGDIVLDDRRRVVNAGVRRGRDVHVADVRAAVEVGADTTSSRIIATRGERLALAHARAFNRGFSPGEVGAEWLGVAEIDADERFVAMVVFDLDNIDAAYEELDARYLAGEAAAHSHTWSVITRAYAALNRRELPAITPDWVNIDHRRGTSFASGEMPALLDAAWNLTTDLSHSIEVVYRLNDVGAVIANTSHETSQEGFDAEWRVITLVTVEGDLLNRCEVFDEEDLDAALARFDELQPQARRLENAASQAVERFWKCFEARDWDAMAETWADDYCTEDRRRVVNAGVLRGRAVHLTNMRAVAEVGFESLTSTVIATRGQRLALIRIRSAMRGSPPGEVSADMPSIVETDTDNRLVAAVHFDSDDIDAAFEELDARYLAGEAAAHADAWSAITQAYAAFNRHQLAAADWITVDHRQGTPFASSDLTPAIRASLDLTPDLHIHIEAVHRLTSFGVVITHTQNGTSPEGFDAEWRMIHLLSVEGGRTKRLEIFDETDLDAALARFDELQPQARRLENAATRADDRFFAYFWARDWAALAEILAEESFIDDRRPVVNAGLWDGREAVLANLRAVVDAAAIITSVIATRGERLALTRIRSSNRDPGQGEFGVEMLNIVEIDSDERIVAHVDYDVDDIDTAFAELDARYLAGEAAAHAHIWSVVARECAAFNRQEVPAAEWVTIDHRRLAVIDASEGQAAMRAIWDVTPDLSFRIEAVHRLSSLGAVAAYRAYGTSPEGFEAEWRMIMLLTVEGDRINRCEVFDEPDLDAALARFDELEQRTPSFENAATRTWARAADAFNRRDVDGFFALMTPDGQFEDRRKGLRVVHEGLARRKAVHAVFDQAPSSWRMQAEPIAIRGSRLELTRECYRDIDDADRPIAVELLHVMELGDDDLMHDIVSFDPDDIDGAFAELTARWIATGEVAYPGVIEAVDRINATINRHDWDTVATHFAGAEYVNHRQLAHAVNGTTADWLSSMQTTASLVPDLWVELAEVLARSAIGIVGRMALKGTSTDGAAIETPFVVLVLLDGERVTRLEAFDEDRRDLALARLRELSVEE